MNTHNDAVLVDVSGSSSPTSTKARQVSGSGGQGMPIVFKDLTYTVVNTADKKQKIDLLKGVSGCFLPQKMCALMGPSGSGKTTLLDVLAGRKTVGEVKGQIMFSAQKPTQAFLRRYTGYVEQFDTLLDILTVRDMLLYTAELKRPMAEPYEAKVAIVDRFIELLALEGCKDVLIGNPLARGISGGQSKRTNIAIAMVTQPRILFLDEPTSGLDVYTSNEVMTVTRDLVSEGTTVCATIHSPSEYAFSLFDTLVMLVRGEVVYYGPNDGAMVDYFRTGTGITPPKSQLRSGQQSLNAADFLTNLVVGADREGRAHEYADAYSRSKIKGEMDGVIDRHLKADTMRLDADTLKALNVKSGTSTPFWWGLKTLIKYRTPRNYRNPEFLGPRIGDKIVFSLLIGTLYLGIGDELRGNNIINIAATLFMWVTLPAFGAASYVPTLVLERPLFIRERSDGLYRPITYLMAKMFDELFITLFASLVFAAIVFFLVDLQGSFVVFWLAYLITITCGIALAYFVAAVSPNMDVANAALPCYVVTLLFFAGFLMRFNDMPAYWEWYSYINLLRYGWSALMVNQFEGDADTTVDGETRVLDFFGLDQSKWTYLGIEAIFIFVLFFFAWLGLSFKSHSSR